MAISPARFESRKPLPYLWRGLENDRLSEVAGIPGCTFVYMSGFIIAAFNKEISVWKQFLCLLLSCYVFLSWKLCR